MKPEDYPEDCPITFCPICGNEFVWDKPCIPTCPKCGETLMPGSRYAGRSDYSYSEDCTCPANCERIQNTYPYPPMTEEEIAFALANNL